jgi:hypothetical protein
MRATITDSRFARRPAASHLSLVFRQGGALSALLRHGSHVRNAGGHESTALQVAPPPGNFFRDVTNRNGAV